MLTIPAMFSSKKSPSVGRRRAIAAHAVVTRMRKPAKMSLETKTKTGSRAAHRGPTYRGVLKMTTDKHALELLTEYRPRMSRLAHRILERNPNASIGIDDLMQVGWCGLIEASHFFDNRDGCTFWTYASSRIFGEMLDAVREGRYFPRSVGADYKLTEFNPAVHTSAPPPKPALDLGDDEVWFEVTRDLKERDRQIMTLYYRRGLAFHRIGKLYGVSESRIAQIVTSATKKLRSKLQ